MNKKTHSLLLSTVLLVIALLAPGTAQEGFAGQYSLTVINTGGGDGTVTSSPKGINCGPGQTCTGTFSDGKKVTLKAKPNPDSSFAGWAGGGCIGINPCSVIMDSDLTITATFDLKTPEISLSTDTLEFDVTKGKKVTQTLVISNIGTGNLIVTVSVEGADFSISVNGPIVIKPNKSYNLKVSYTPSSSGTAASSAPPAGELEAEPLSGPGKAEIEPSSESEDMRPSAEPMDAIGETYYRMMHLQTNDPKRPNIDLTLKFTAPRGVGNPSAAINISNYFSVLGYDINEEGTGDLFLHWNSDTGTYEIISSISGAWSYAYIIYPPGTIPPPCTVTCTAAKSYYGFSGWLDSSRKKLYLEWSSVTSPGTCTEVCPEGESDWRWGCIWGLFDADYLIWGPYHFTMAWSGVPHMRRTCPTRARLEHAST